MPGIDTGPNGDRAELGQSTITSRSQSLVPEDVRMQIALLCASDGTDSRVGSTAHNGGSRASRSSKGNDAA